MPERIPDRQYFKIGEAADIVGVETHVLRFWESEFPQVRPQRTPKNQRLYRRKDIETLLSIKTLLYEKGMTIPGARQQLARKPDAETDRESDGAGETLAELRSGLIEIKSILDGE